MLKKDTVKLTCMWTIIGLCASAVLSMAADPSLGNLATWLYKQLGIAVLMGTAAVATLMFVKKETSKAIITLVLGGVLYVVVTSPAAVLKPIGTLFKNKIFGGK